MGRVWRTGLAITVSSQFGLNHGQSGDIPKWRLQLCVGEFVNIFSPQQRHGSPTLTLVQNSIWVSTPRLFRCPHIVICLMHHGHDIETRMECRTGVNVGRCALLAQHSSILAHKPGELKFARDLVYPVCHYLRPSE
jgi:hypothetical protein